MLFVLLFPPSSFVAVYDDDDDDDEKTTLFIIMCAETTQTPESFATKSEEFVSRAFFLKTRKNRISKNRKKWKKSHSLHFIHSLEREREINKNDDGRGVIIAIVVVVVVVADENTALPFFKRRI